jgi:hypothetical protein
LAAGRKHLIAICLIYSARLRLAARFACSLGAALGRYLVQVLALTSASARNAYPSGAR